VEDDTSIRTRLAPALFVLTVFAGALVLGLVVLPVLGAASGMFVSATDAQAFFSFATLKGVPVIFGASILSVLVHPFVKHHGFVGRVGWTALDIVICWSAAAAYALVRLG
jgi:hypothetical protein